MGRYTTRLASLSAEQRSALADAVHKLDGAGRVRLVAYVVPRGNALPDAALLRAHCRRELPEYMVPSVYVSIAAVPMSPSGKIDRKALPSLISAIPSSVVAEGPRGLLEEALAAVWCRVLSLPSVGRDDDFFADLGGHSLLAARLLAAIRETIVVPLQLRDLFEQPTIRRLAGAIDRNARTPGESQSAEPAITRRSREAHRSPLDHVDG